MTDTHDRTDFLPYLAFATVVSFAPIMLYLSGRGPIKIGALADSDCYMHLLRASDLYRTGQWYDPVIERSNPPYGDRLHWTRPFDILLLAGAIPGSLLTSFDSSLFWWGVILSPLLLIASFLALRWAMHPLLGNDGSSILGFLFAAQIGVMSVFQAGRPDHHSLLELLFLLILGYALRLIGRPFAVATSYSAGAISALSMWVSVESLVVVGITLAALGILWVVRGSDFSRKALHYAVSLLAFTSVALVLERAWHDLATIEFDRLSIVYVGMVGMVAALSLVVSVLAARTGLLHQVKARLLAAVAVVSAMVLATWFLLPSFFRGPLGEVRPEMMTRCLAYIQEMRPLLHSDVRWVCGIPLLGYSLAYPAFVLTSAAPRRDPRWIFLLAGTLVFGGLSFLQVRWVYYAHIFVLPPPVALIMRARATITGHPFRRLLANCAITGTFIVVGVSGFLIDRLTTADRKADPHPGASLQAVCEYLNRDNRWQGRCLRLVTHLNFGAEILYRTPDEVIATLYHRNWQGILDTCDILTAETDEQARRRVCDRAIGLILLCPDAEDATFFSEPDRASTFYQRLCQGKVPPWCREVPLPSDLASFRLFEIRAP